MGDENEIKNSPDDAETLKRIMAAIIFNDQDLLEQSEAPNKNQEFSSLTPEVE